MCDVSKGRFILLRYENEMSKIMLIRIVLKQKRHNYMYVSDVCVFQCKPNYKKNHLEYLKLVRIIECETIGIDQYTGILYKFN